MTARVDGWFLLRLIFLALAALSRFCASDPWAWPW